MALTETTIYVVDAAGDSTDWFAGWLCAAGLQDLREPAVITEDLPWKLHELQREKRRQPALVILTARVIDERVHRHCAQLQNAVEEGWLGCIVLIDGNEPAEAQRSALGTLCMDVLHAPDRRPGHGTTPRLVLSLRLLHERFLRISREQMFQAQLAQRRVAEARLHYRATHDELTDLANRRAFEKALDVAIHEGQRRVFTSALLYLDLDRFKLHNDAVGHGLGDHLLRMVGNELRGALPVEYLLARLGSDEFAVLLPGAEEQEALEVAEGLRGVVAALEPDGEQIVYHMGVSIGLAIIDPGTASGASQVLAQAEQACYVAKTRGGNAVHRFSREDEALQNLREDMRWARPVRRALAESRFFLTFQPLLSIAKDRISHYEALLRIPTGLGGDGLSARFVLAAERLGLAQQIDLWVVDKAIDFITGHSEISLCVNLSSHAFQEPKLLPLLHQRLESSGIDPKQLTFEITETAAIMNFAETRHMIGEIRSLGCRFALDDFGSGFSSYNYIKQFPVDMLKIDGSFVAGLRHDRRDQAIVRSMVDIGHGLDKEVVAEFIEDEETLRVLVGMGIDYAQGYLIGRPSMAPAPRPGAHATKVWQ